MVKVIAGVLAASIGLAASAASAQTADEKLTSSVMVEWVFANCDEPPIPATLMMATQAVISGTDKAKVDQRREWFRGQIEKRHPQTATACAELVPLVAQPRR